jgi:2,3-bisphosphoglycerate-independent phosphoglycerate mutase
MATKKVMLLFSLTWTDRGEVNSLLQMDLHEQNMHKLNLYYVTLTNYMKPIKM